MHLNNIKYLLVVVLFVFIVENSAYATAFHFPGPPNSVTAPFTISGSSDTLSVDSGNMSTSSGAFTIYSTQSSGFISVLSGATVTFAGAGTAMLIDVAGGGYNAHLTINGTVTSTNGNSISIVSINRSTNTIALTGVLNGPFLYTCTSPFSTTDTTTFDIDGTSAQINGSFTNHVLNFMTLRLGFNASATFQTNGSISNVQTINLVQGSFTVQNSITGVSTEFSTANGTTLNLNASMTGSGTTSNSGTMNINNGATYNVTGAFTNNAGNKTINVQGTFTVPSTFTNTGTIKVDGTVATINGNTLTGGAGASLIIGQTDPLTSFTTSIATSGIPTITLTQGTFNINNAISGVTNLSFASGTFANVAAAITGSGTFANSSTMTLTSAFNTTQFATSSTNPGIININNVTLTTNASFVHTGSIYLYGASANISGAMTNAGNTGSLHIGANSSGTDFPTTNFTNAAAIRVQSMEVHAGTYTTGAAITGVSGTFIVDSAAIAVLNQSFTGAGAATNKGTLTISNTFDLTLANGTGVTGAILNLASTGLTKAITNAAGNTINITGATTSTSTFSNSGTMKVSAAFTATSNTVANGGTLEFATNAANSAPTTIQQGGSLTVTGTNVTNASAIGIAGSMTIAGTYSGAGVNTTSGTGSVTFASGSNASPFTIASGTNLYVTGTFTNTATITNQGTTTISAALNGAGGTINNTATNSVLTLANGASVANTITSSKIINITGNAAITTHNLTSSGTLNMSGNLDMTGLTLTNSGRANISGNRTLTANSYISSGSTAVEIRNATSFDSLATNGTMDFTGGTLIITSNFDGQANVVNSWTLLSADGGISGLTSSQVTVPGSNFYELWQVSINPNTVVVMSQINQATAGINARIAAVLNQMSLGPTNAGQRELLAAFGGFGGDFNKNLHQMIPINNALQVEFDLQNSVFNKAETRIAALRNGAPMTMSSGINVGDMAPDCDMWLSTFGAWTNQKANEDDDGFNAKTVAVFLGMDNRIDDDYLGAGLGYSNSHTSEYTSADFIVHTHRYHALFYGTHNMKRGNYVDFLATGNYNISTTSRYIMVNNNNLSTEGRFTGYQMAGRISRGKAIDFWDSYRITPLTYAQYVYLNQNQYNETGSVAALSVENRSSNIVTIGAGTKLALPMDAWELVGLYELRALGSYDVVSPHNITTASFMVGSNSFQVISAPARWALQLGAGITYELSEKALFELNYDYEMRSKFSNNTLMAKFKYLF